MKYMHCCKRILLVMAVMALVFGGHTAAWSHGEGTSIVPAQMSVRAGETLKVEVKGLVNAKTAAFKLTGLSGTYDLGKFAISSDDFTQVLKIPAGLAPGSYRLTVEGGGKTAKVVITIN